MSGQGDPNGEDFALATAALYAVAYAVKMSYKKPNPPEGAHDYKVFPLEGVWDLVDRSVTLKDKTNYAYTLMIRQPEFLTKALFDRFLEDVMTKKKNPKLNLIRFEAIDEGVCCQMLHIGPYDDEPATFQVMHEHIASKGFKRTHKQHKEIYLSDPRRSAPEKMKTILRFKVDGSGDE